MTIDLQTLKCGECGSSLLRRTGLNQYLCEHCGSTSVVEDNVSDRLDRVLEQVKGEAARRLAEEEAAQRRKTAKASAVVLISALALMLIVVPLLNAFWSRSKAPVRIAAPRPVERTIPPDSLQIGEPRQVLAGSGSSARPKLLVVVRNQGDRPLERPGVKAVFYDGDTRLGEAGESVPIGVLMPGESAPLLIDLPGEGRVTRQALEPQRLAAPSGAVVDGARLQFARARLVQQGDTVRLLGRLVNTRTDAALAAAQAMVTLYDDSGTVIGFGRGYAPASELKPGERTAFDVRVERVAAASVPIAAWDYRIDYALAGGDKPGRAQVVSRDRVVRTEGGPESFNPGLRLSSEELLADDGERFDLAQLQLLPLVPARSITQDPVYFTEIVNRSADAIALAPGVLIARFDGSRADGTTAVTMPSLYPGERFPVLLEPRRGQRITQTRTEWKPLLRAALPGRRPPLEVQVTGTRADTSSVLVNFSRRYSYRFVQVSGQVKNSGSTIVRKPVLWVSLRDRDGQLTGFTQLDNLPAIGPGDSVPFQAKVDQLGRDFASVGTLYQTE